MNAEPTNKSMATKSSLVTTVVRIRREAGQTLVVAIIILGLLLIIGFVFLGIIDHSIKTASFMQNRSATNDLSEAGIRYAHEQLLRSQLGADWRGQPTPMIDSTSVAVAGTTRDPDAFYLRPPANTGATSIVWPGSSFIDQGGPDGLGPFFRVNFQGGRALVRVRYAPSDANIFRSSPNGALRNPGAARNYIILESVGRRGTLNANDPTAQLSKVAIRFRDYANAADFNANLNQFKATEASNGGFVIQRAFASIGIIESARFITNKYHVSTPAEIGVDSTMGAIYRGASVGGNLPVQYGGFAPLLTKDGAVASAPTAAFAGFGGMQINADVFFHGVVQANLNLALGEGLNVAGSVQGDPGAMLILNETNYVPATNSYVTTANTLGNSAFSSTSIGYSTANGAYRDGSTNRDANNIPRGVGYKAAPSADVQDPSTGVNRYLAMTRDSGPMTSSPSAGGSVGNSGRFGYGEGVYVDNFGDVQGGTDEASRLSAGGAGSLINDWLNPSQTSGGSWNGYFYTPPAAYLTFDKDGWTIIRNSNAKNSAERTWKNPDGSESAGGAGMRFKVGRGSDHRLYVVNSVLLGNINGNLGVTDFDKGQPFNGVLYFEGNVRVRGVIPTDIQLTVVSHATIYVEGSITKGIYGNQWTASYTSEDGLPATANGTVLNRPSKSLAMLIAKDNVAINTTQFYGPTGGQPVQAKQDLPGGTSFNPVLVPAASPGLTVTHEFLYDPIGVAGDGTVPSNPGTWKPFVTQYTEAGSAIKLTTNMLIAQTMDDGPASNTFIQMLVNAPNGVANYLFPTNNPPYANGDVAFDAGALLGLYGLGTANYQRYGNFEQIALPLIDPTKVTVNQNALINTAGNGNYSIFTQTENQITIQPTTHANVSINDLLIGRFATVPDDIRIEASMFAEEGCFFVIPGPWFNPNPNDTYDTWQNSAANDDDRNTIRLATFGASPQTPFYGEPIDARIVITGAVSENMPPTAAQQAESLRKWGWIPQFHGATTEQIPKQHVPAGYALGGSTPYVPNIIFSFDPVLATGRRFGFVDPSSASNLNDPGTYVRTAWIDYNMDGIQQPNELVPLPPLPRLPVSPTLAYFGEVH